MHSGNHKENRANSGRMFDKRSAPIMVMSLLSPDASGAGPRTLKQRRIKRHPEALFHARRSTMAAGVGILRDGRSLCPVFATPTCPPPKPRTEVADSITAKESEMSHDTHQGDPRPQSVPSLETISNALATVDAVAALLEHALTNPSTITPVWSRGLSATLKNLACQIDGANLEGLDEEMEAPQ